MRRFLTLASASAVLFVCVGCSGSGFRSYMFSRQQAGNVTASDSIGSSLFQRQSSQASVAAE